MLFSELAQPGALIPAAGVGVANKEFQKFAANPSAQDQMFSPSKKESAQFPQSPMATKKSVLMLASTHKKMRLQQACNDGQAEED